MAKPTFRELAQQALNVCLVLSSALLIWKGLGVLTNCESSIVVVLSGSMRPAFDRGDLLFLSHPSTPFQTGDICIFNIDGKHTPIVHRVMQVHTRHNGTQLMLTKGDNNTVDDRVGELYRPGQMWIGGESVVGKVVGTVPYVGWVTILMNEYGKVKGVVVFGLAVYMLFQKEK
ncbi:signal peptidase I [Powellomyces hirtus]|nr:signal peptidase I [Powellomyces hirtus]